MRFWGRLIKVCRFFFNFDYFLEVVLKLNVSRIFFLVVLLILYLFDFCRYAWVCGFCVVRSNVMLKWIFSWSRVF